jgi:hypothetical protein
MILSSGLILRQVPDRAKRVRISRRSCPVITPFG